MTQISFASLTTSESNSQSAYLTILATRHVMRAAVNTRMKITMFFRAGRCVMMDEIREPAAASVTLRPASSSPRMDGGVEFKCVAGDGRVCGSPLARQRAATTQVRTRPRVNMVLRWKDNKRRWCFSFSSFSALDETRQQSHFTASATGDGNPTSSRHEKARRKNPSLSQPEHFFS